jgi:hypothetical protein
VDVGVAVGERAGCWGRVGLSVGAKTGCGCGGDRGCGCGDRCCGWETGEGELLGGEGEPLSCASSASSAC